MDNVEHPICMHVKLIQKFLIVVFQESFPKLPVKIVKFISVDGLSSMVIDGITILDKPHVTL